MSVNVPDAHCRPPPFSAIVPEPKLFVVLKLIKPPVTVVPPEYVFVPESVSVPLPILVSASVPDPSWIVPLNVPVSPFPLVISVTGKAALLVTTPPPASDPMAWLKPARSSVAPEAMLNALVTENVFAAPARSVPAFGGSGPIPLEDQIQHRSEIGAFADGRVGRMLPAAMLAF